MTKSEEDGFAVDYEGKNWLDWRVGAALDGGMLDFSKSSRADASGSFLAGEVWSLHSQRAQHHKVRTHDDRNRDRALSLCSY